MRTVRHIHIPWPDARLSVETAMAFLVQQGCHKVEFMLHLERLDWIFGAHVMLGLSQDQKRFKP